MPQPEGQLDISENEDHVTILWKKLFDSPSEPVFFLVSASAGQPPCPGRAGPKLPAGEPSADPGVLSGPGVLLAAEEARRESRRTGLLEDGLQRLDRGAGGGEKGGARPGEGDAERQPLGRARGPESHRGGVRKDSGLRGSCTRECAEGLEDFLKLFSMQRQAPYGLALPFQSLYLRWPK